MWWMILSCTSRDIQYIHSYIYIRTMIRSTWNLKAYFQRGFLAQINTHIHSYSKNIYHRDLTWSNYAGFVCCCWSSLNEANEVLTDTAKKRRCVQLLCEFSESLNEDPRICIHCYYTSLLDRTPLVSGRLFAFDDLLLLPEQDNEMMWRMKHSRKIYFIHLDGHRMNHTLQYCSALSKKGSIQFWVNDSVHNRYRYSSETLR